MCLVLIAFGCHPRYPLVVAANRDEFHERPTDAARWWPGARVLAGRDREAGGSWFAIERNGRFGAVTNYRDPAPRPPRSRSRGELPLAVLDDVDLPAAMKDVAARAAEYGGFNLIAGDAETMVYLCSEGGGVRCLRPGFYALSNHMLDTPWPKVERGRAALQATLANRDPALNGLLDLLGDRRGVGDQALPHTGVPLEWERLLAPVFIVSPQYGTRCSSAYLLSVEGEASFAERRFDRLGRVRGETQEHFHTTG